MFPSQDCMRKKLRHNSREYVRRIFGSLCFLSWCLEVTNEKVLAPVADAMHGLQHPTLGCRQHPSPYQQSRMTRRGGLTNVACVLALVLGHQGGAEGAGDLGERTRQIIRGNVYWGFGEPAYYLPKEETEIWPCLHDLIFFSRQLLDMWEVVWQTCEADGNKDPDGCRSLLLHAITEMFHLSNKLVPVAAGHLFLKVATPSMEEQLAAVASRVPSVYVWQEIVEHHYSSAVLSINGTVGAARRLLMDRMPLRMVVAVLARLLTNLSRRLERFQWHLTYYLLTALHRDGKLGANLPPLVFHDYCCTSAEVVAKIVVAHGLHEPLVPRDPHANVVDVATTPLNAQNGSKPWGSVIVEVGVETGATSKELLKLMPQHVRLVGVDPFDYRSVSADELTAGEQRQRTQKEFLSRYDESWLQNLAVGVERIYAEAQPTGRAQFIREASPGASNHSLFSDGADMVFIDGDHAYSAVAKDIAAWLHVLRSSRGNHIEHPWRRRVLAGHDFTLMHVGVVRAVLDLAQKLELLGPVVSTVDRAGQALSGEALISPVHVACNAIWWMPLSHFDDELRPSVQEEKAGRFSRDDLTGEELRTAKTLPTATVQKPSLEAPCNSSSVVVAAQRIQNHEHAKRSPQSRFSEPVEIPKFDFDVEQLFRDKVGFGFGEEEYNSHPEIAFIVPRFHASILLTMEVFGQRQAISEACGEASAKPSQNCKHYLRYFRRWLTDITFSMMRMLSSWLPTSGLVATEELFAHHATEVTDVFDLNKIVTHHWVAIASLVNITSKLLKRCGLGDASTPRRALASVTELVHGVGRRTEIFRWHITYYLFFSVQRDRRQTDAAPTPVFHEFCCSTAEVISHVANQHGLLHDQRESPLPDSRGHTEGDEEWDATLVQIGVETGELSQAVLALLPERVRFLGVRPSLSAASSDAPLMLERDRLKRQMDSVERVYARVRPSGRAQLLHEVPYDAQNLSSWASAEGVDFVFVAADSVQTTTDLACVDAWLRLFLESCSHEAFVGEKRRPRVLAGLNFSFWQVIGTARGLDSGISSSEEVYEDLAAAQRGFAGVPAPPSLEAQVLGGHVTTVHIAAGGVWWISF
eukprot:TRINITY_DN6323_c0_g2_i1.p1 TRINITY_DN6323_c0_g2~~TRINITY_DN6323_c0_g2_i1.p1  ORF type:complete len:1091 (-),score=125.63 TRINITY_DN6323_c0_g2_i1:102-3374(-)